MDRRRGAARTVEDFDPAVEWKQAGDDLDIVEITLPGFRKEHVRVQVDNHGVLRATGERPEWGGKSVRFSKDLLLPKNCDADGVRARFEDEKLIITLPTVTSDAAASPQAPSPSPPPPSPREPMTPSLSPPPPPPPPGPPTPPPVASTVVEPKPRLPPLSPPRRPPPPVPPVKDAVVEPKPRQPPSSPPRRPPPAPPTPPMKETLVEPLPAPPHSHQAAPATVPYQIKASPERRPPPPPPPPPLPPPPLPPPGNHFASTVESIREIGVSPPSRPPAAAASKEETKKKNSKVQEEDGKISASSSMEEEEKKEKKRKLKVGEVVKDGTPSAEKKDGMELPPVTEAPMAMTPRTSRELLVNMAAAAVVLVAVTLSVWHTLRS